jgi:hypothetical protein
MGLGELAFTDQAALPVEEAASWCASSDDGARLGRRKPRAGGSAQSSK